MATNSLSSINKQATDSNLAKAIKTKTDNKKRSFFNFSSSIKSSNCCISIWSTWYCLLIVLLHIYLVKKHIERIIQLQKLYNQKLSIPLALNETVFYLDHYDNLNISNQLYYELVSRICLLSISLICLLLFLIASLKQVGNYSNDGIKFGRDFFFEKNHQSSHMLSSVVDEPSKKLEKKLKAKPIEEITASRPSVHLAVTESSSLTGDTSSIGSNLDSDDCDEMANDSLNNQKKKSCKCLKNFISSILRFFKIMWRHFLPFNSFFHLLSILFLILPDIVHQNSIDEYIPKVTCSSNQLIKEDNLNYRLNLKEQEYLFARLNLNNSNQVNHSNLSTCLVSNLFKFKSNFIQTYSNEIIYETSMFMNEIDKFKFELVSICLALISMYIRYGTVFWFTNKTLSFLITFIGFVAGVEQLIQLYSFVYISKKIEYKIFSKNALNIITSTKTKMNSNKNANLFLLRLVLNQTISDIENEEKIYSYPDEETILSGQLIDSRFTLFFLYSILSIFVYLSATPGYAFAYLKYKERFRIEEALFIRSTSDISSKKKQHSANDKSQRLLNQYVSTNNMDLNRLVHNLQNNTITKTDENNACCFNYCPHLVATIQLIVMCGCKLPFCYDYILYFNYYKDFGIMICIIVEILHTIILLFIWLTLTLRNEWSMHLQTAYSVCHWTYHLKLKEKGHLKASKFKKIDGKIEVKQNDPFSTNLNQNIDFLDQKKSINVSPSQNIPNKPINSEIPKYIDQKLNYENHLRPTNSQTNGNNRYIIEKKHKSLFVENNNPQVASPYQIAAISSTSTDYLCNSETVYRNEIRKSIRNILQKNQQIRPSTLSGSSLGISNNNIAGNNSKAVCTKTPIQLNSISNDQPVTPQTPPSNYYQQHQHHHKYIYQQQNLLQNNCTVHKGILANSVYLSTSGPQIVDSLTSIKTPTFKPQQNTRHSNRQSMNLHANNGEKGIQISNNDHARSVLYLDRESSSSIEYESRV